MSVSLPLFATGSVQGELLAIPESEELPVAGQCAQPVARIVLEQSNSHLDHFFDYLVPPELDQQAQPGVAVEVPFGPQRLQGWIWERSQTSSLKLSKLRPIRRVVSDLELVPATSRTLIDRLSQRLGCDRASLLRLAMPARNGKVEKEVKAQEVDFEVWQRYDNAAWNSYELGQSLLLALAQGKGPRCSWQPLPGQLNTGVLAAVQAILTAGRAAIIVTPNARKANDLAQFLSQALGKEPVLTLTSEMKPSARYRVFVKALLGQTRIVVGTRAAAWLPLKNLGLAVLVDDEDSSLIEPHHPYVHARTVLATRAMSESIGLIVASYSCSVQSASWVRQGWMQRVAAPRNVLRTQVARVTVQDLLDVEREGDSGRSRIPSLAHRFVRTALAQGPVLVQVARGGYAPMLACQDCREVARCPHCNGPLQLGQGGRLSCRYCGRPQSAFVCTNCGSGRLRMVKVGSIRTAEELGRALPGMSVLVSGASASHGVIDSVDESPRLVVATPGAEPVARGGYSGVLLLDGAATSQRAELGSGAKALRHWSNAVALVRPGGRAMLVGDPEPVSAQALLRWDQFGYALRDLQERQQLHLPPAWRCVRFDGLRTDVGQCLDQTAGILLDLGQAESLGPVSIETEQPGLGPYCGLLRVPLNLGAQLAQAVRQVRVERSAKGMRNVRVQFDPPQLW